jgi:peptide/nickel transport system ATP-binding protein
MSKEKNPLVEVENVSLYIGKNKILKNLSFKIYNNEIVAIVGESGSGKSMTALSLIGLQPKQGIIKATRMIFDNQNLMTFNSKDWQKNRGNTLGIVFQEPQSSLNPSIRCGKQLFEVLQMHRQLKIKQKEELVKQCLRDVQLNDYKRILKSYPHELSGGQKQRVMIAMALLCNPKLLIADEPTTALDVTVQKEIMELLKSLQKKYEMSILFISHNLAIVKQLADRVLVMHEGRIVESENSNVLFQNPKHNYTKGLMFARPEIGVRLERLPTIKDYSNSMFKPKKTSLSKRLEKHNEIYAQKPLIEIKDFEKNYFNNNWFRGESSLKALHQTSFSLYPGETLGLVGESGCGKSTLAKTLVYLDPATSGEFFWQGVKVAFNNKNHIDQLRKDVQLIFQDPYSALHPYKTVGRALEEVLFVHSSKSNIDYSQKVIELLSKVGLDSEYRNRYPHELSGGQCQRVVIARALAVKPKVLICDESVAALDISVQAQVLNLLNDLKRDLGLSYIFISHDLAVVKYMSDRIMVMQNGSLVELQEADKLYKNPKNAYTKKLIDAIP